MAGNIKKPSIGGIKKEVKKMPEQTVKTAPATGGNDDTKLIGALGYIIMFWVPLFVLLTDKKNNKTLLFHAWQSLLFLVAYCVFGFGLLIVGGVAGAVTGGVGAICVGPLYFVPLLYALFLAYKTYQGEKVLVPVIGPQAEKMAMK